MGSLPAGVSTGVRVCVSGEVWFRVLDVIKSGARVEMLGVRTAEVPSVSGCMNLVAVGSG